MKVNIAKTNMTDTITNIEILIIGGGIIGSSIAYHAARQGRKVLVVERQEAAVDPAASWASAGGIRPQGLHPAEAALAHIALARWPHLSEELEADLHYAKHGHLLLAESESEAEQLENFIRRQHELGFADVSFADRKTVMSLVPGLGKQITAGSFSSASGHANPRCTSYAFAAAAQRHGAIYWTDTECLALSKIADRVVGAQTRRGTIQAKQTVLAAGAWSHDLASSIGIQLPVRVRVLQTLCSTPATPGLLLPVLSTVKGTLSLKQQPDGAFLLGGGWLGDPTTDGRSYTLRKASQAGNWLLACEIFPLLRKFQIASAWGGLQAQSFDDLPFIGSFSELEGLTLALGSWYGFALAPAIGKSVANHLAGLLTPELDQLTPDRIAHFDPIQVRSFMAKPANSNTLE